LGRQAAELLGTAGRRAAERGDMSAAVNLLERATALLPARDPVRAVLLPALGQALVDRGQWEAAAAVLAEAVELGGDLGFEGVQAEAIVAMAFLDLHARGTPQAHVATQLEKAMRLFERAGD